MIQPRPYQTAAISAVQDSWRRNDRVLVSMPTGTGKTICGSLLIGQWPNICGEYGRSNRVLWLAQRDELIWQAAEEIYAVTGEEPAVEKGEFRSTKSAELFHRRVVVSSVQTMAHRKERFGRDNFGLTVLDEAHHGIAPQHMEVLNYFGRAKLLGISISGDAYVLIKTQRGIRHVTLQELWTMFSHPDATGIVDVQKAFRVRAFNGKRFVWKSAKALIRHHSTDKRMFRIMTERGIELRMTEDHSVFRLHGTELTEARGSDLRVGDTLLLETRHADQHEGSTSEVAIGEYLSRPLYRIYGDFASHITTLYPPAQGQRRVGNTARIRYERMRGKHGPYLTLDEWKRHASACKGRIGIAGRGRWCESHIPSELLAFLLGYYVGDGWTNNGRICLAVATEDVPRIEQEVLRLASHVDIAHVIHPGRGRSVELQFCNQPLGDALSIMCGLSAATKRIPDVVFDFPIAAIRKFIDGLLASDGHLSETTTNKARWYYVTVSKRLAYGLQELLRTLGVVASIHTVPPRQGGFINGRRVIGRNTRYTVHWSAWAYAKCNVGHRGTRRTGLPFSGTPVRITSVEESAAEYVYDISVDDSQWQTFVANGILVHNTATTDRADEVSLGKVFQDVPYCYGIEDAIRDGYLCPIVSKFVEIKELDFGEIRSLVDIPLEQLDTILAAEGPLHRLVRPVFKESGKRQTIVFCPGVKTAHAVAALLDRYAGQEGSAFAVDGETPEEQRRDIIERYKRGEYQFLVNANLLLEGFNAPTIACVAMLRPTKSRMLYAQAVGRGLRGGRNAPVEGKDDCLILDMVGASYQHKLCTSINLLGGSIEECVAKNAWESIPRTTDNEKPEEKPATDLQAAMAAAIDQADDLRRQERQRILAEVRYNLKDTSPFDWLDIQERPMEGWWDAKPPTQEQLAILKANGIQTKGLEYTQAKQLCDAIAKRLEEGYCTPRQARTLVAFGYSPTTPAGQAVKILAELKKRGFKHTTDEAIRFQQAKIERENREIATTAVAGEAVWGPRGGWLGFVVTLPRGGKKLIKNRDRARELARAMQRRGVRINGGKKPPTLGAQGTPAT